MEQHPTVSRNCPQAVGTQALARPAKSREFHQGGLKHTIYFLFIIRAKKLCL